MTRTLPAVLPDVIDELTYAVPDCIPANENGRHTSSVNSPVHPALTESYSRMDLRPCVEDDAERGGASEQPGLRGSASL